MQLVVVVVVVVVGVRSVETAVADDHAGCQDLAAWLHGEGYRGVLAPSAALPGSVNLTVFGGRYEHMAADGPSEMRERDPDRWLRVRWRPRELTHRRSW